MTFAALCLLLLARPQDEPAAEAVRSEWWVRAVALAPAEHAEELARELAADEWRRRARALDALARAAGLGRPLPPALAAAADGALADAHPSVRAHAVQVAGARGAALPGARAAELAAEPLASVRLALARALEHAASPARAALLGALAVDADERVRGAAENALCGLPADEPGVAEAWLGLLAERAGTPAAARYVVRLARAAPAPARSDGDWLVAARAVVAERTDAERALIEALAFAQGASADAALCVRGFLRAEDWEPDRARLAGLAARRGSPELARAARAALDEAVALPDRARQGLVGMLVDALDPGSELAFLDAEAASPATCVDVLAELGLRRDAWDPATTAPWTDPARPADVRLALLGAVAGAHVRAPAADTARVLVRFLAGPEPELATRAFEVLCESGKLEPDAEAALHVAFRGLGPEERVERMGWFARTEPRAAFRADWIELGARGGAARASACELLAGFEGDGEVRAAVAAWLAADLARVTATPDAPERALEQLVQAELRALARVDAAASVDALAAALAGSFERSHEIGKLAAAGLGRSAAGRARLAAALVDGTLAAHERRTRIEACIVLAQQGEPEWRALAAAELVRDRPGTAWDLRERVLRALAESGAPAARDELERLALAPGTEAVERLSVAALLGGTNGASSLAVLRALAAGEYELEARTVALRALGRRGDVDALLGFLAALRSGALAGSAEDLAVLRGELVVALGMLDPPPAAVCAEWLRAPGAGAARDLEARLAGHELAASEFAWRHELELARLLARHDAGPGSARGAEDGTGELPVSACLEGAGPLARLDGRFLVALGELLADGGASAAAERALAAAEVALAGERDADRTRIARVRARRFLLAWERGDWACAAALAERTLGSRRAGEIADTPWTRLFGTPDRAAGVDPSARLRAAAWQARALAELEAGRTEAAREAAARAARECGRSRIALAAQRELEARLELAAGR